MKILLLILLTAMLMANQSGHLEQEMPDPRNTGTCMQPPYPTPPDGCTATDAVLYCYPGCECKWEFENCHYDQYKYEKYIRDNHQ